ncbi:hypothetical protein KC19_4G223000 [Ceratodon purpureus]|uniref:Uncharacterized protein n=1 Tax=Ceratodon purpureus TaxID=3225 RepID=A0A8T0IDV5_CERPU|nr:hypothetical protein KC19_4G223000 [Ceratodon purpureus]
MRQLAFATEPDFTLPKQFASHRSQESCIEFQTSSQASRERHQLQLTSHHGQLQVEGISEPSGEEDSRPSLGPFCKHERTRSAWSSRPVLRYLARLQVMVPPSLSRLNQRNHLFTSCIDSLT